MVGPLDDQEPAPFGDGPEPDRLALRFERFLAAAG
jgi:hypothetical protein